MAGEASVTARLREQLTKEEKKNKKATADDRANAYNTIKSGVMGVLDIGLIGANIMNLVKLTADNMVEYEENGAWKGAVWCYSTSLVVNFAIAVLLLIQMLCLRFRATRQWHGLKKKRAKPGEGDVDASDGSGQEEEDDDAEEFKCARTTELLNANFLNFCFTALIAMLMLIAILANQAAGILFQSVTPKAAPVPAMMMGGP
eukprot:TRINITY_DN14423_c0_g1_i1.p2 TRINITY_DN14423_c0_g1~~TRINITY_DN14423_c0_g1_i1.p2  ORF type:complete len:202 (-),score=56.53 TRINITY_DN14423_c0_g1_i1:245-850(-)